MKKILIISVIAIIAFISVLALQTTPQTQTEQQPSTTTPEAYVATGDVPTVTIEFAEYGTVVAELYPEVAPNTVNNFIELAQSGYYDGLSFHRVINGFMIQGGDPEGNGTGGPGYAIKGEFAQNNYEAPTLSHEVGVLSMARSQSPDSAGSQFFIVSGQASHLDGQYASFGKVVEGLAVVEAIQNVATDKQDAPITPVIMTSVTIDLNGYTPAPVEKITE
ncbi:MAG: peptidylprolyl isomerase [Culicoidibacterales bacterium]